MITLDATTRSLEIDLSGAVTTNQLPFVTSYVDISQSDFSLSAVSSNSGQSNDTTAVTPVAAPGASTSRQIKYLSIRNADTATATVTVQFNDNSTLREIGKWLLAVDDTLVFTDVTGFYVLDSDGARKYSSDRNVDIAGLSRTNSNFIVGDGTNFIAESGATVRTSIGLGTSDLVTFAQLNVDNLRLDGNTLSTTNTDGDLILAPNGTGIIKTAAKTMIGSISVAPDGTLHVFTASSGSVTADTSADDIVAENSGAGGFSALVPNTSQSFYAHGSPADSLGAFTRFQQSTGIMDIGTALSGGELVFNSANIAEAMRILSNQDIRLSAGTSALATNATGGFPGMPTMAGDPSGTPTNESAGFAPFCYDTTTDEFKVWNPIGNAWHVIAMAAQ